MNGNLPDLLAVTNVAFAPKEDLIATATVLTAATVARAIESVSRRVSTRHAGVRAPHRQIRV